MKEESGAIAHFTVAMGYKDREWMRVILDRAVAYSKERSSEIDERGLFIERYDDEGGFMLKIVMPVYVNTEENPERVEREVDCMFMCRTMVQAYVEACLETHRRAYIQW